MNMNLFHGSQDGNSSFPKNLHLVGVSKNIYWLPTSEAESKTIFYLQVLILEGKVNIFLFLDMCQRLYHPLSDIMGVFV
jgi:hypothetical protein